VLAEAPPFAYASLDEIAQSLAKAGDNGLVLALDGVQDPHNLGAVIRSAAAFGAQGVVIPLHGACEVTLAAERASAGAASRVPVARVTNLAKALDHLKQSADAWVATADARGGQDPARAQPPRPLVLVLGSEAKGVRPNVAKRADLSLTLPVADAVESLNISVAAAVLMYALRTA
jgi:23S rRNA (guanosine2251-2'-O)-methyltransferase